MVVPVHVTVLKQCGGGFSESYILMLNMKTKIMTLRVSKRTACLVVVVPGGADHHKLTAHKGFNLEDSSMLLQKFPF